MADPSRSELPSEEEKHDNAGEQLPLWEDRPRQPVMDSVITSTRPVDYGQLPGEFPQPPDEPAWQMADLGVFILFAIGTLLLANFGVGAVFYLIRGRLQLRSMLQEAPFVVSMQVLWEGLWFLFIYYTITEKYRQPFWRAIHWFRVRRSHTIFVLEGVFLAFAAQGLLNLLPAQKELPIERLFTSAAASYLLAFFGICVAPFIEELVFRGFFYPVFERRFGIARAVLITAALFAMIHGPQLNEGWAELTAIFMVGVALSYTRGKTGSLIPSYLMHVSYNTSLFAALYFSTNRFHTLHG